MSSDTTKLVLNTDARTVNTKTPIRLGAPRTTSQDDRISVCRRTWVARLYYLWMQKDMGSQTLLSQYAATLIISVCWRTWAARLYYLSMQKDMGSQTLLSQYAEGLGQPDSIISVCSHSYYLSMLKDMGSQTLLSQYAATLIISGCRRTWAARLYYLSMQPLLLSQYAEGHGQPDSIISVCRRTWAARLYYLSMQPLLLSQYAEGLGQPNSTELHRNQYLCMRKGTIWCWRDFHRAVFCNTPPSIPNTPLPSDVHYTHLHKRLSDSRLVGAVHTSQNGLFQLGNHFISCTPTTPLPHPDSTHTQPHKLVSDRLRAAQTGQ